MGQRMQNGSGVRLLPKRTTAVNNNKQYLVERRQIDRFIFELRLNVFFYNLKPSPYDEWFYRVDAN